MNISEYLFPNNLSISNINLSKILFIGSCNARDFAVNMIKNIHGISIEYLYYGVGSQLPEKKDIKEYQLQYIQLPLREIIGDSIVLLPAGESIEYTKILNDAVDRLSYSIHECLKYNIEHGLLSVVSNFIVPQSLNAPSLQDAGTNSDLSWIVYELNKKIPELIKGYKNTYLGDTESAASSYGKNKFLDDVFYFTTHGTVASSTHGTVKDGEDWSYGENHPTWAGGISGRIEEVPNFINHYHLDGNSFYNLIYSQLNWIYKIINQADEVKIVIFDLDNTLWRGQIGEHYDDGLAWPDSHGWPVGIWEAIQILRRRGIIVSISSKNDESIVRERWGRAVNLNWIKYSDFVSPRVNWASKGENILSLLKDLSLTPKNALFVDDNPIEREEVKSLIPGIRVIGSNPYETRRILLWSSETNKSIITKESMQREKTYQGLIERSELQRNLNRDDFLKTMNVSVFVGKINSDNDEEYARALELLNKTNQFNTTGMKWTRENLNREIHNGMQIFFAKVQDKFSNYGLTAVLLLKNDVIQQFVMSCRVLGLDIDKAMLSVISNMVLGKGEIIVGAIIKTELNSPCQNIYEKFDFEKTSIDGVYMSKKSVETPKTIKLDVYL